ncbi:MAG: GNAT family N-acetyltransferase [Erysipelotrichaceae bacterium]|nr:GNAT family N-acetyltransferase [Erysipelotrichaceae bacterium]
MKTFNIIDGSDYLEDIKELIIIYTKELDRDLSFQNLDKELSDLKEKYVYPHGRILAAKVDNQIVGCVAYYRFSEYQCEMKRLYVLKEYRHLGIGQSLVNELLTLAKQDSYKEMVLDTITPLSSAIHLYHHLGFKECDAYYYNPMDDVVYMKKEL